VNKLPTELPATMARGSWIVSRTLLASVILSSVVGVIVAVLFSAGVLSQPAAYTSLALVAVLMGTAFGFVQVDRERTDQARARQAQDALLADFREVRGVPELAELMDFNERQMRVYQELSTSQARSSYRRSQFAFVIGLALIGGAIAAAFAGHDATTKVAAGGVAGLGGAFSAYISATYLRVYERTLDQLNFYYRQPLVNSYLLTAERLADGMSPEKRDAAYDELLREVLGCARAPEPSGGRRNGADTSRTATRKRKLRGQAR